MKFMGYERPDGTVGIRNHILVLAVADCSEPVARMISEGIEGSVPITHHCGCIPGPTVANTLIGIGENPNIAAVLLVGMGCEGLPASALGEKIKNSGKPVDWITIQELGGTENTVSKGREILAKMQQRVCRLKRKEFEPSRLVVGVKCGGSDTTSGIAGNPAVGVFVDMLVDAGGTALMGEPIEAVGAEAPLARRAINPEVKKRIYKMISDEQARWSVPGAQVEFMCKGNVDGGLSTIEEKSLGAIHKSGNRAIKGVLEVSDHRLEKVPAGGGLYLQDATHIEPMSMSFMGAAGVQLIVFVTGCGGTFGHAIAPLIKVTGNPETYKKMAGDMDINAGTIISGDETIESVGERIFNEVVEVASGKKTFGESFGYHNFSLLIRDQRLDALLKIAPYSDQAGIASLD